MQIDMERFRQTFYVEAAEHLESMEANLLQLENCDDRSEMLNTIFRSAHSIKGASMTFGFEEVGKFTHVLENLLDAMREGKVLPSSEIVEVLLESVDIIDGLIDYAKSGGTPPANVEEVLKRLTLIRGENISQSSPGTTTNSNQTSKDAAHRLRIQLNPSIDFFRFGQDPALLLRELRELGEVESLVLNSDALPRLGELNPESCYLSWTLVLKTTRSNNEIEQTFMFLDDGSKFSIESLSNSTIPSEPLASSANIAFSSVAPASAPISVATTGSSSQRQNKPSSPETETVRVDRIRLDEMINQIGELVIGTSMVEQELRQVSSGAESAAMAQLAKIVRDLQEMSLSLRMVPIAATFQKMARVVRDLARKLDKKIEFVTEGEDTELDKSVVDQIGDPLVHMVRNAADHGIEPAIDRVAKGKTETGTVRLRAFQQGGNIFIEVEDDGRGLDRSKILAKAIERGLITSDANLSDTEVLNLIFRPGFSTAESVTDVSGRGVGMDVVRRNVEALQGSITIRSELNRGSVMTVRLPLTLAILDGLLIRLQREVYVLPLLAVIESISIKPSEIREIVGVGEVVLLRGEVIPLIRLQKILDSDWQGEEEPSGLLVIVEEQTRRFALMVDELLGQQQVVIKNLETNFRKVPGVAGATILGNGQVALILDIYGISCMLAQPTASRITRQPEPIEA